MFGAFFEVELAALCMTGGLIKLNNTMLQIDVKKTVVGSVGRPFDESWLRAIHGLGLAALSIGSCNSCN